jgi:hypothetical protein
MCGHSINGVFLSMLIVLAGFGDAMAGSTALVTVQTPRGAKQAFILIKPEKPVASVILFAGGHGALGLKTESTMRWGALNFLVRSREKFAAEDLMVAVIDAPSDHQTGMNAVFRMSHDHAEDIGAVAAYLKAQANIPVWVVGTSMGTFSSANGAIGASNIDGLVLTSTITRSKPDWKIAQSHRYGVASMALQHITVPTLIVSHRHDACDITPATDAPKLSKRLTKSSKVDVVLLDGGDRPRSEPCEARSRHGFFGIESEAVSKVVQFVKENAK